MDYCNNKDLEEYVQKKGGLGEIEALYFLKQIMNAFKCLNSNKIMHRDIKLANLFLNNDLV